MNQNHNITDGKHIHDFLVGGKAMFTIRSHKTGKHFTYKISKSKKIIGMYFVSINSYDKPLLNGSVGKWSYIGVLTEEPNGELYFRTTQKSTIGRGDKRVDTFMWFVRHHEHLFNCDFFHIGKCGKCGRTLTDPTSIEIGLGPICRKF